MIKHTFLILATVLALWAGYFFINNDSVSIEPISWEAGGEEYKENNKGEDMVTVDRVLALQEEEPLSEEAGTREQASVEQTKRQESVEQKKILSAEEENFLQEKATGYAEVDLIARATLKSLRNSRNKAEDYKKIGDLRSVQAAMEKSFGDQATIFPTGSSVNVLQDILEAYYLYLDPEEYEYADNTGSPQMYCVYTKSTTGQYYVASQNYVGALAFAPQVKDCTQANAVDRVPHPEIDDILTNEENAAIEAQFADEIVEAEKQAEARQSRLLKEANLKRIALEMEIAKDPQTLRYPTGNTIDVVNNLPSFKDRAFDVNSYVFVDNTNVPTTFCIYADLKNGKYYAVSPYRRGPVSFVPTLERCAPQ